MNSDAETKYMVSFIFLYIFKFTKMTKVFFDYFAYTFFKIATVEENVGEVPLIRIKKYEC